MIPPPMMGGGFMPPMPMMGGNPFDQMASTLGPLGSSSMHHIGGTFNTISDTNLTAATTQLNQSQYEETERKNKAKIELLEKKIRAKD